MNFADRVKETSNEKRLLEEDVLTIKKELSVDEVVEALAKVCADVALKSGDLRLGNIVGLLSPLIIRELYSDELKEVLDD